MTISEDLENAVDIVELVQRYSKIKKAWANFKAVCPFPGHTEKTPSFVVSPAKQLAYCFGCHKWWGPLKFIMDIENCEFRESLQILGWLTGIKVWNVDPEKTKEQKTLFWLYKDAASFYKQSLKNTPEIKKILIDRGITQELIEEFHFWYAPSWVELYNHLKNHGYEDAIIEKSQIFNNVSLKKDKFINRIIFPIQNARWDFVAFAWRIVDTWEPKYINSPASSLYDKSSILYGLFKARHEITKKDAVIITEWYMDTIALHKAWFYNTVAVSGTALTDKHIIILKRLTHKIYLCFDGDNAWAKATKLSIENLKNNGLEVKIITLPKWKDPDDFLSSWWDFQTLIDSALSPIGYLIATSEIDMNSLDEKSVFLKNLLGILKSYDSIIEKDYYLKEIAQSLDLREATVYEAFNKTRLKKDRNTQPQVKTKHYSSEDYAIATIINTPDILKQIQTEIIFPEYIPTTLQSFLQNGINSIDSMPLETKEFYKALAMKIDSEFQTQTHDVIGNSYEKLIKKINHDAYKKAIDWLKQRMKENDMNALVEYNTLMKTAQEHWIK